MRSVHVHVYARILYVLASRPLKNPLTTVLSVPVGLPLQRHPPTWCLAPTPCMHMHMHCNGASTIGHVHSRELARGQLPAMPCNWPSLVHYLTAAGMICRPEVRFLRGDRKTRPDFLIADAHGGLLLEHAHA